MTDAERQRRRRARLREQPWLCPRPVVTALTRALRDLQDPAAHGDHVLTPEQVTALIERMVARLEFHEAIHDNASGPDQEAARAYFARLLNAASVEQVEGLLAGPGRWHRRQPRGRCGGHGDGHGHDHVDEPGDEQDQGQGQGWGRGRGRGRRCRNAEHRVTSVVDATEHTAVVSTTAEGDSSEVHPTHQHPQGNQRRRRLRRCRST